MLPSSEAEKVSEDVWLVSQLTLVAFDFVFV